VIRENPASRGTETSAEVLVGPPRRMVSNAGQQQWYGGYPCTPDGGPMGHSARSTVPPPPSASSVGVGRHRGSTWVRQFSPPPESHPEPRGVPVQWADPGVKPVGDTAFPTPPQLGQIRAGQNPAKNPRAVAALCRSPTEGPDDLRWRHHQPMVQARLCQPSA
jgi:hypothetical protein